MPENEMVKTLVWSVLLYGAEGWTLLKSDENRIMATEMWFWRKMLNISWKEKRTNLSILRELNIERELLGKVIKLKLGYFGHILRGSGSPLAFQIEGIEEAGGGNSGTTISNSGQDCSILLPRGSPQTE